MGEADAGLRMEGIRRKAARDLGGERGAEEAPGRPDARAQGPRDRLGRKPLGPGEELE